MDEDEAQALAYQCELENRFYEEKQKQEDEYWQRWILEMEKING